MVFEGSYSLNCCALQEDMLRHKDPAPVEPATGLCQDGQDQRGVQESLQKQQGAPRPGGVPEELVNPLNCISPLP